MPRGTAKHHTRRRARAERPVEFDDPVRSRIRAFFPPDSIYPNEPDFPAPDARAPQDQFVDDVLNEVQWAVDELKRPDAKKADLEAELASILQPLNKAAQALRTISPALDEIVARQVHHLDCTEAIEAVAKQLEAARLALGRYSGKAKRQQRERAAAQELAVRVLRIAKGCGIPVTARGGDGHEDYGEASRLLKAAAAAAGIRLALSTCRGVVERAMLEAADLQHEKTIRKRARANK